VYVGCVGRDENGRRLRRAAEADGLQVEYMEVDKAKTGLCAVLINGLHRSLVARLGASSHYHPFHLLQSALQSHIVSAKLVYITGFFLTTSPETIMQMAALTHEHGKQLAMNLSAPFLSHAFKGEMLEVLPFVDYLFGNEGEARAFAEANGLPNGERMGMRRL